MAVSVMPIDPSLAHQRFEVTLDEIAFQLEVRWSAREECYYLNILNEGGTVLRAGLKLVIGSALGGTARGPGMPPGLLHVVDTSGETADAGYKELGVESRVQLWYTDWADLRDHVLGL